MIIVNGVPKSGTHSVMSWFSTMGLSRIPGTIQGCGPNLRIEGNDHLDLAALRQLPDNHFSLGHVAATHADECDGLKVITVFRDPRNCLISYQRHRMRKDGIEISTAEALASYWGAPFIALYRAFLPWRGRSIVLRYEELPQAMIGDGSNIYPPDSQHWNTWTGCPSDWTEDWGCEDHAAWREAGGPELARDAGY